MLRSMTRSSTRSEAISRLFAHSALRCESSRNSAPKPRVARDELPWEIGGKGLPWVALATLIGLEDTIPLGLPEIRRTHKPPQANGTRLWTKPWPQRLRKQGHAGSIQSLAPSACCGWSSSAVR